MAKREIPREMPANMTPQQKRDNWWRYHWLYVLCGVLAVIVVCGIVWEQVTQDSADCSVALVTRFAATPAEIASLQAALERVAPDVNGDGEVHVAVNAIQIDYTSTDLDEAAIQSMTTNVDKLNSDFYTRQSGLFLLDDPENFQTNHEALAYLDGTTPDEGAADWENMTIPLLAWSGADEVEWDNCLPETLWFAQRAIFSEKDEAAFSGARAVWAALFGED